MKALTLLQPWATLIAICAKEIETRSWYTKYRGRIAIHAAKRFPEENQHLCFRNPFRKYLIDRYSFMRKGEIYLGRHSFPLGCVIAICDLVDCLQISSETQNYFYPVPGIGHFSIPPEGDEYFFGDYSSGRWAWILNNIEIFPDPIPA